LLAFSGASTHVVLYRPVPAALFAVVEQHMGGAIGFEVDVSLLAAALQHMGRAGNENRQRFFFSTPP